MPKKESKLTVGDLIHDLLIGTVEVDSDRYWGMANRVGLRMDPAHGSKNTYFLLKTCREVRYEVDRKTMKTDDHLCLVVKKTTKKGRLKFPPLLVGELIQALLMHVGGVFEERVRFVEAKLHELGSIDAITKEYKLSCWDSRDPDCYFRDEAPDNVDIWICLKEEK